MKEGSEFIRAKFFSKNSRFSNIVSIRTHTNKGKYAILSSPLRFHHCYYTKTIAKRQAFTPKNIANCLYILPKNKEIIKFEIGLI